MRIRKQQSGFAVVELVLVVVVVAAIVVAGLWVYQKNNDKSDAASNTASENAAQTQSPVANNVSTAPPVKSSSDLDRALNVLDQNDPSTANKADSGMLSAQSDF